MTALVACTFSNDVSAALLPGTAIPFMDLGFSGVIRGTNGDNAAVAGKRNRVSTPVTPGITINRAAALLPGTAIPRKNLGVALSACVAGSDSNNIAVAGE